MPPVLSLLLRRPGLVLDHLANYGALLRDEAAQAGNDMVARVVAWVIAGVSALMFLIFAGVALMLGFVTGQFHWVLLLVPGAMLIAAIVAWRMARRPALQPHFAEVRAQVQADLQALREAGKAA